MKYMEKKFNEWKKELVHTQYKVILPDGRTLDKGRWISHKGFNLEGFNKFLEQLYNDKYRKDERE